MKAPTIPLRPGPSPCHHAPLITQRPGGTMRTRTTAAAAALLLATLTACGGSSSDAKPRPTVTVTATETAELSDECRAWIEDELLDSSDSIEATDGYNVCGDLSDEELDEAIEQVTDDLIEQGVTTP